MIWIQIKIKNMASKSPSQYMHLFQPGNNVFATKITFRKQKISLAKYDRKQFFLVAPRLYFNYFYHFHPAPSFAHRRFFSRVWDIRSSPFHLHTIVLVTLKHIFPMW